MSHSYLQVTGTMSLQEEGELWGQFRKLVVLDELKGTL